MWPFVCSGAGIPTAPRGPRFRAKKEATVGTGFWKFGLLIVYILLRKGSQKFWSRTDVLQCPEFTELCLGYPYGCVFINVFRASEWSWHSGWVSGFPEGQWWLQSKTFPICLLWSVESISMLCKLHTLAFQGQIEKKSVSTVTLSLIGKEDILK